MGGDYHPHSGELAIVSAERIVRAKTNERCHVTSCRDSGCSLSMKNAPEPNVLLSLEHKESPADASKSHCDFLFVGGGDDKRSEWVAPVELTTGTPQVSKFLPQLQAGASIAEELLPRNVKVSLRPIAVHGKILHPIERNKFKMRSNQVMFRNKPTPVTLVRCGSPLTKALSG